MFREIFGLVRIYYDCEIWCAAYKEILFLILFEITLIIFKLTECCCYFIV